MPPPLGFNTTFFRLYYCMNVCTCEHAFMCYGSQRTTLRSQFSPSIFMQKLLTVRYCTILPTPQSPPPPLSSALTLSDPGHKRGGISRGHTLHHYTLSRHHRGVLWGCHNDHILAPGSLQGPCSKDRTGSACHSLLLNAQSRGPGVSWFFLSEGESNCQAELAWALELFLLEPEECSPTQVKPTSYWVDHTSPIFPHPNPAPMASALDSAPSSRSKAVYESLCE